jgi:hypothetical protein
MGLVLVAALLLASVSTVYSLQGPGPLSTEAQGAVETAFMPAAAVEPLAWSAEAPSLSVDQLAQLERGLERSHLSGPVVDASAAPAALESADPRTQSDVVRFKSQAPLVPGSGILYRSRNISSTIPAGLKSNVLEASVATGGKFVFYTGNWFAARSTDGGFSFSYVNSFSGFPDFCCDQVTIYDEARNAHFWLRQGIADVNGENIFKLGVSTNGAASFCTYNFAPKNVNSAWTNNWFDYPHMQLGADYLYIAYNIFNAADVWQRTVMLRLPLDQLSTCAGFSYNYYWNSGWFTFVPVSGATHTMYFASNWPSTVPQNSRLGVWKWDEASTTLSSVLKNVAAWTFTNRGSAVCGAASGNWAARYDQRVLTGARHEVNGSSVKLPGRTILAWWWNVRQGGGFAQPYIEGAAFYEDTFVQLAGLQGRPFVWNSSTCFAYPSFAPNDHGDLGGLLHYSTGTPKNPSLAFTIADDYAATPPGWPLFFAALSNARPTDNKWGDYNTVREFQPGANSWVGAAHVLPQVGGCCNAANPFYLVFGRERDRPQWLRFQAK